MKRAKNHNNIMKLKTLQRMKVLTFDITTAITEKINKIIKNIIGKKQQTQIKFN